MANFFSLSKLILHVFFYSALDSTDHMMFFMLISEHYLNNPLQQCKNNFNQ